MASTQWSLNPATGDYIMEDGAPVNTASLTIPAYIRLKTPNKGWMYAPDDRFGSKFHLQKKRRTTQDPSAIEAIAEEALTPLVEDLRADSIEISTVQVARHAIGLQIDILDAQGQPDTLNLEQIGV